MALRAMYARAWHCMVKALPSRCHLVTNRRYQSCKNEADVVCGSLPLPHKARNLASMRRSSALFAILRRAITILMQFSKTLVARAFASCQALQAARKRRMTCWTRSAAECSALVPLMRSLTKYPLPLVWSTTAAFLRRRRRRRRSARTRIRPPRCRHWIAKAARFRRLLLRALATRLRA